MSAAAALQRHAVTAAARMLNRLHMGEEQAGGCGCTAACTCVLLQLREGTRRV